MLQVVRPFDVNLATMLLKTIIIQKQSLLGRKTLILQNAKNPCHLCCACKTGPLLPEIWLTDWLQADREVTDFLKVCFCRLICD